MEMSHGELQGQDGSLRVVVVESGTNYCARVSDVEAYVEVCREVSGRDRVGEWVWENDSEGGEREREGWG